jgi:hypothetical protein
MGNVPADFVFVLKLLDESFVFVDFADDVLQGVDLVRIGVADKVDAAAGTLA